MASVRALDTFLAKVVPWPTAATPGYVNVHWLQPNLSGPAGRAFTDHRKACQFVFGMKSRVTERRDLYVCMSLQRLAQPPYAPGKQRALRAEEDVVAIRSLYIDVDVKPGRYATFEDGLRALKDWRTKTGMPEPSVVVASGNGIHVHWVLDEPIPLDVWRPLAAALRNATQQLGLMVDVQITTNPVCILRIPDTYNFKSNPPKPVVLGHIGQNYPLALLDQILTPYKTSYAPGVTRQNSSNLGRPSAVFAGVNLPGRLDAGIDTYQPTIEEVAEECPFIDATLQTGGAGYSEPLWFESLKVAYYVQEGAEVAHELSDGHATYSEADTDKKFGDIEQSHSRGRIGWPQCRSIHDAGAQECRQCPHLPQNRSPLNFAVPIIKAAVAVATAAAVATSPVPATAMGPEWLPTPYKHDPLKRVYYSVPDPASDDKNKLITKYVMPLPIYRFRDFGKNDEGSGRYMVGFDCEIKPGTVRTVSLTYSQFSDGRKLADRIGELGVPLLPDQVLEVRRLMVSFVQQLKEAKQRVSFDSAPDGWLKKDGKIAGFVYAHLMHNGADPVPIQPLSPKMDVQYQPTGELAKWKDVVKLITDQQRPELNAAICASIGAPLIMITGMNGAVLHLWGESGGGKTNSLRVAQSVWGSPAKMSKLTDTAVGIDVKLGQLHNLPVIYDDVTKGKDRKLIDLFMRVGEGQTKQRAERSGLDLAETYTWNTLMISASNPTMHSHIAEFDTGTVAAINRVFEYQVMQNTSRIGMLDRGSEAARRFGMLDDNFGLAGLEIAKFYGANYDLCADMVAKLTDAVDRRGQCGPDDRFYVALIGVTLGGGLIGKKLGLIDVDMDRLEGFLIEALQDQRQQRKVSPNNLSNPDNIERLLAEFVHSQRDRMLMTREVWTSPNRPPKNWNAQPTNMLDFKGERVVVRGASTNKIIRLGISDFNSWLKKERGLSVGDLRAAIKAMPNVRIGKFDLGQGVPRFTQARVIGLEISDPSFWDFD